MKEIYAQQYDTIDAICWRHYGRTVGVVERVLEVNPQLAEQGVILDYGTKVFLPDITTPQQTVETIQLWK